MEEAIRIGATDMANKSLIMIVNSNKEEGGV